MRYIPPGSAHRVITQLVCSERIFTLLSDVISDYSKEQSSSAILHREYGFGEESTSKPGFGQNLVDANLL